VSEQTTQASAIVDAYAEANQVLDTNRRELSETTAKISADPELSEDAKSRYIDEARARAQAKYVETIDGHDQAVRDTLEANVKRLFNCRIPKARFQPPTKRRFAQATGRLRFSYSPPMSRPSSVPSRVLIGRGTACLNSPPTTKR
jgi:hypothetical protein